MLLPGRNGSRNTGNGTKQPQAAESAPAPSKLLNTELLHPEQDDVLIEQDEIADFLLLVQQGRLAVESQQTGHASRFIAESMYEHVVYQNFNEKVYMCS